MNQFLRWSGLLLLALNTPLGVSSAAEPSGPKLVKLPIASSSFMENTPIVWNGRPLLVLNHRDDTKNKTDGYVASMYCMIKDLTTGEKVARLAEGHSFVSALVDGRRLHVFASQGTNHDWFGDIHHFWSDDLKTWQQEPAIVRRPGEHLFNSSVCRDEQGYLMAYESNQPVTFCFRFARSKDLSHWETVPGLTFTGENHEYSACPVIRCFAPYYYVIYLHAAIPGHNGWVSYVARSKDLETWELSPLNPILETPPGEGVNASDVDLFEWDGGTYLYYATGDQQTWSSLRVAHYAGSTREMFERWFPDGQPPSRASAKQE